MDGWIEMKTGKKLFVPMIIAMMLLASCSSFKSGDVSEVVLELTQHDPPDSATGRFLEAWAEKVFQASGGRLKINVNHGGTLGGPRDTYDLVLNNSVDIGWGMQSYFPNRFPVTEVMMLPMLGIKSAAQGSRVLWDMYENTDLLKNEYKGVHVLLLHTNCDSPIATRDRAINTMADLRGVSLRTNAGPPTEFVRLFGGNPVSVVVTELYSSLEKGVVQGVITDWHAIWSFKFYEQLKNYYDVHASVSPYFLVINQGVYDALPADLQKVLDDSSGTAALDIAGSAWDDIQREVTGIIRDRGGNIAALPEAEMVQLEEFARKTWQNWVAQRTAGGYPAQEALDAVLELINKSGN
jgi:TRAP-type C4-dicarboxylate transport system substrate-binding protein